MQNEIYTPDFMMSGTIPDSRTPGIVSGTPSGRQRPQRSRSGMQPMVSPMTLGEDGADHLNMWVRGQTALGRFLDQRTAAPFIHSELGRFCSIEAFWKYVLSAERCDELRNLSGRKLRGLTRKLTRAEVHNFRAIIMDANWQKLQQYAHWGYVLRDCALPLDCYYVYKREDGVRIRPDCGPWLIRGFNEIRTALRDDREPVFDFLKNRPHLSLADCLKFPTPKPPLQAEEAEDRELIQLSRALAHQDRGSAY